MKAIRILLSVAGAVIVLVIVIAVFLISRIDPNEYKDEITAFVQERTGRTLTIGEDIELSLFPWFAVETGGLRLSDDPAFGERDIARIEALSARVRVWPLLRRRVEIGRVVLDGIDVNLGIDAAGRGNWSSLIETASPPSGEPAAASPAAPERAAIEQFAVAGIELRNARVRWYGVDGEVRYLVRDLGLETGPIADAEPVELTLGFSLLDVASQASFAVDLRAQAAIAPAPALRDIAANLRMLDADGQERLAATLSLQSIALDATRVRAAPAELTASLSRPPIGPASLPLTLAWDTLEFDRTSERLSVAGLTLGTDALSAELSLAGENLLSAPRFTGRVALASPSAGALLDALAIAPPAGVDPAALGSLAGNADFAVGLDPRRVDIERFSLAALGAEATGNARLAADGSLAARIELPAFRPAAPLLALANGLVPAATRFDAISRASAAATLALSPADDRLELSAVDVRLDQLTLAGELVLTGLRTPTAVAGRVTANGLDNRLLGALFGAWVPAELLAADLGDFRLATDFDYAPESGIAAFAPVSLSAYGLTADGELAIDPGAPALTVSGRARLGEFSPRSLLSRFDLPVPATSDPAAFDSARLAASFSTTGDRGDFRDIVIALDDATITGEFSVEDFADPAYRFVLHADRIDADRYLPPRGDGAGGGAGNAGAGSAGGGDAPPAPAAAAADERRLGDIRLASDALAATDIEGTASVGALTIGGMRFEQLATDLAVGQGRAALNNVRTRLYGGDFAGGVSLDATADVPVLRLTGDATALSLRPLLTDMLGGAHLAGSGDFALDLTGSGATIGEAMQTAAGSLNVALRDGQVDGINVGRSLCAAVNSLRQLPAPAAAPDATAFSTIRATATVADGVASSSDLYAATGFLELTGTGRLRLADQWLRNDFVARLTGPIELAGCERLNSRIDGSIPIGFWLEGQLPGVDYGFDVGQLIEDWVRREIRNQAEDALRERLLRGLLD